MNPDPYALPGDGVPILDAKLTPRTMARILKLGELNKELKQAKTEAELNRVAALYDMAGMHHTARRLRGEKRDNCRPEWEEVRKEMRAREAEILQVLHDLGGRVLYSDLMNACNMSRSRFFDRVRFLKKNGKLRVEVIPKTRITYYVEVR